jgi:hypothetical protein
MRQPEDKKTAELPGMPNPTKLGRKPIGDEAMTAAERKRRSRAQQREKADWTKDRVPAVFSCDLDETALFLLRRAAKAEGIPIYAIIETLIKDKYA